MNLHINDVYVLREILKKVKLRDYDLIEDREVNALLEECDQEWDAHMKKIYAMAAEENA